MRLETVVICYQEVMAKQLLELTQERMEKAL